MLFTDILFLYIFLPICLITYYSTKKIKYKNNVLIGFSLFFYTWGMPIMMPLLILSAFINYLLARSIQQNRKNAISKISVVLALLYNIGILGFYKYTDFLVENINNLFGTSMRQPNILMPLGISFFTFQIISYVVDVYWEKINAERKFTNLLLYISLFPNVMSGPIVRYETVKDDIDNRNISISDLSDGVTRLITGLAKKVIIADNLIKFADTMFGTDITKSTVVGTWAGVVVYSLQVYYDFSGYSDMAIGLARMLGFKYNENFNYPFMCRTISEFWQRWHISLGSFFKDYLLYVPIFGKRRQYASLFLVWFTTGLWHGASWNYIIWGLYFGLFILFEMKLGKKRIREAPNWLMHLYNKLVIVLGFGIFRFTDIKELGSFFLNLFGLNGNAFINDATVSEIKSYIYLILAALIFSFPIVPSIRGFMEKRSYSLRALGQLVNVCCNVVLLGASTVVLIDSFLTNKPFLYWSTF